MIKAVIVAMASWLILYMLYMVGTDLLYGSLTDIIGNSTDMSAESKQAFEDIKLMYKLAIGILWISILAFLAIMSLKDERVDMQRGL